MKTLIALFLLSFSVMASAETCTAVIKDRSGYELETFSRSSYSKQAACDQASYDCRSALSYAQSYGRYQGAICDFKLESPYPNPFPYPQSYVCQTDLVDYYGRVVRAYTAPGSNEREACYSSDDICRRELQRSGNGSRCITRGLIDDRNHPRPPQPGRTKTESCSVNRHDPAGMFIQRYMATSTGPMNSDVKGEACRRAVSDCARDLRGRQTCNIAY